MRNRLADVSSLPLAWLAPVVLLGVLALAACGSEPRAAQPNQAPEEEKAVAFELPEARGGMVSLTQLLEGHDAAALVFYRGFF